MSVSHADLEDVCNVDRVVWRDAFWLGSQHRQHAFSQPGTLLTNEGTTDEEQEQLLVAKPGDRWAKT